MGRKPNSSILRRSGKGWRLAHSQPRENDHVREVLYAFTAQRAGRLGSGGRCRLFAAGPAIAADETNAGTAIRPFSFHAPEAKLADLRRRISATQWPERETVTDATQGVQFATMQKLARYWASDYDWRKAEARINALPNFMIEIDGLDIHFIHVRSKTRECGYRSSSRTVAGLDHRAAQDHRPADRPDGARRQRIGRVPSGDPSLPGYGFSARPTAPGWDPARIARAWGRLIARNPGGSLQRITSVTALPQVRRPAPRSAL